jgi:hypothetical protein
MSTYLDVRGNPDEVSGKGSVLKAHAEDLAAKAAAILSDIQAIDAGAPWGQDEPGLQFQEQYLKPPKDSSGPPLRDVVQDHLSKAGELLSKVGDGIVVSMAEYQGADAVNEADIGKL